MVSGMYTGEFSQGNLTPLVGGTVKSGPSAKSRPSSGPLVKRADHAADHCSNTLLLVQTGVQTQCLSLALKPNIRGVFRGG